MLCYVNHGQTCNKKYQNGVNILLVNIGKSTTLRACFTKLRSAVKVDLTGRFDENLVICVSPTFK